MKKVFHIMVALLLFCTLGVSACTGGNNTSSSGSSSSKSSGDSSNGSSSSQEYDVNNRLALDENEIKYSVPNVETYYNYIEVFDDKGRVYTVGDPYIVRYNGLYYLYVSCSVHYTRMGIPCWTSTNLVDWTFKSWVYGDGNTNMGDYDNNGNISFNAYAPEVIYYKGWFYMCQSVNGQGHYILRSSTPDGKFQVCSENLGCGIDGDFYVAENGDLYLFFAWDNSIKYIKLKIENDKVLLDGTPTVLSQAYLSAWVEGPETIERNDYKYLLYTGNHVNSADYRMAYSYTTSQEAFLNLEHVQNNILLVNTGDDTPYNKKGYNSQEDNYQNVSTYRGLGHGSAHYGPNLDSIYLAYHSQGRNDHTYSSPNGGFDRRFNLTQMYTNNAYLTTNGISLHDTPKPTMADVSTNSLCLQGEYNLTDSATKSVYTAEINFKLQNGSATAILGYDDQLNYTEVTVQEGQMTVNRYIGGQISQTASGNILVGENDNYHCVKVINGYNKATIYYDNLKVLSLNQPVSSGGKIGVAKTTQNGFVTYTNDAYGTSDFEAIKNLTTTFPAYTYLKEENRGYSIKNATVKADGLRQGEKESSTNYSGVNNQYGVHGNANYITLESGDWVKYAINAPEAGTYSFNVEIDKNSKNCIFEVIVDETDIYKMEIKNVDYGGKVFVFANAGTFNVSSKGIHSLKVRVYSGTLNLMSISTQKNAESVNITESLNSGFNSGKLIIGKGEFNNGLTCTALGETLYYVGNKGVANFSYSVDVTLNGGVAGLVFRAKNYNYTKLENTIKNRLQGYYVEISQNNILIKKYDYIGRVDPLLGVYDVSITDRTNIKIEAIQNVIKLYVNSVRLCTVYDDYAFMDGYCGIYCVNSSATFNNLIYKNS